MALDRLSAVSLPARSVKPTFSHNKKKLQATPRRPRRRARRVHDGRDQHAHGTSRRLELSPLTSPRPLLAPRPDGRGYHSVCNSTLTVAATASSRTRFSIFADDADAACPRCRRRLVGERVGREVIVRVGAFKSCQDWNSLLKACSQSRGRRRQRIGGTHPAGTNQTRAFRRAASTPPRLPHNPGEA